MKLSAVISCHRGLCLLALLFSSSWGLAQVKDSSYLPLAIGNKWIYRSDDSSIVNTETIVDTQRVNGRLYYGMAINSSSPVFWLRKEGQKVYFAQMLTVQFDTTEIIDYMIYDFGAKIGDGWSTNYKDLSCWHKGSISLKSTTDTIQTPSGRYTNCYYYYCILQCRDAGRWAEWFAPGIGEVQYLQDYFSGGHMFYLQSSHIVTGVSREDNCRASKIENSLQNYPNPFNPTTNIVFQISEQTDVTINIYDMLGRYIATIEDSNLNPGLHSITWDASNYAAGLYICRIVTNNYTQTVKLELLR